MQSAYRRPFRSLVSSPQANATHRQTIIASAVHKRCTIIHPVHRTTATHQVRPTTPNTSAVATMAKPGSTK